MLKLLLKFAVLKIKGREIILDVNVTNADLISIFLLQSLSILRGLLKLRQLVFLGHKVKIKSKYKLTLGKGVSIGDYSTLDAMSHEGLKIGTGSSIGSFSLIKVSGTLTSLGKGINIGCNVGIGDFAHIGGAGGVFIGDDTIAGAYLSIHPENHVFSDTNELIRKQGVTRKGISIGKNCWIGAKVTILDGSIVGDGCVIAAGSVVNGKFPDHVVIGGVPAKILKEIKNVK
jgi:acetyltransferase-like isoleucine patch superfamily enzyme